VSWMGFGRGSALVVAAAIFSGCYAYIPAPASPPPGTHLLLELSDKGRIGLSDSIGPAAHTIEGTTIGVSDTSYAVRVLKVGYVNGQSNSWTGEPLTVSKSFVSNAKEQRFSRSRTWLTAAAATAAAVTFIVTRGLGAFGSNSRDPGNPQPAPD
jgi:hypothetical protein